MKISAFLLCFSAAIWAQAAQVFPAPPPQASQPFDEQAELARAAQQAGAKSPVDFIRAFEPFLEAHPNSQFRERIIRALFQASKDLHDDRRIADYGQKILAIDPDDIGVLADTGRALNNLHDPASAVRALEVGEHLFQLASDQSATTETSKTTDDSVNRDAGRHRLATSLKTSTALIIEADALGQTGKVDRAIAAAHRAFDLVASAESARALAHWQAAAGHNKEAVEAYADAFAIADSSENHADDRRRLTELYRLDHSSEQGLGDIVLAADDRMTAYSQTLDRQLGISTDSTKPIDRSLSTLAGVSAPLIGWRGRVIVMDFWATWCGPCRAQHPLFEQVRQQFRNNDKVVFLEVASEEDPDTVKPFVEQQHWNSASVYLDNGLSRAFLIDSIPTTVLLARNGELYSKMVGFRPESFVGDLAARINSALASSGDPLPPVAPSSSRNN